MSLFSNLFGIFKSYDIGSSTKQSADNFKDGDSITSTKSSYKLKYSKINTIINGVIVGITTSLIVLRCQSHEDLDPLKTMLNTMLKLLENKTLNC